MKASDLIRQEIAKVFAKETSERIEAQARCGPFALRLSFASQDLARMFLPAYVQRAANSVDPELRFVAADHHDLSALVPEASQKPRLLIEDGIYSVWQPAVIPVLYAVDLVARRAIACCRRARRRPGSAAVPRSR